MIRAWRRRRRALVCRDAVALMSAYVDGMLTRADQERLERHLADCPLCTRYLEQLRATVEALGQVSAPEVPEAVVDELVALYQRWQTG